MLFGIGKARGRKLDMALFYEIGYYPSRHYYSPRKIVNHLTSLLNIPKVLSGGFEDIWGVVRTPSLWRRFFWKTP
jgi:hypothetical protein